MEIYIYYNFDINYITNNFDDIQDIMILNKNYRVLSNEKIIKYSSFFPVNGYNIFKLPIITNMVYVLEVLIKTEDEINKEFTFYVNYEDAFKQSINYYNRYHVTYRCLRCNNCVSQRKPIPCNVLARMNSNYKKYTLFFNDSLITIKIYPIIF